MNNKDLLLKYKEFIEKQEVFKLRCPNTVFKFRKKLKVKLKKI